MRIEKVQFASTEVMGSFMVKKSLFNRPAEGR